MDNVGVLLFLVGAVGTWYFIKKKPDKNNRNISIGLLVVGIALIVIFTEDTEEVATESSEAKVEQAESSSSEVENQASSEVVEESSEELSEVSSAESVAESTVVEEETETTIEEVAQEESVPREYRNALSKAESYLSWAGMSEQSLREQLEFEEYPSDAIDYALANVEVDYNEQALAKAESYDGWASMSDSQLYDQLIFEGFTDEQAQYALDNLPQ